MNWLTIDAFFFLPQPDTHTHTFIPLLQLLFIEMGCFLKLVELGGGELRLSEEGRQVKLALCA